MTYENKILKLLTGVKTKQQMKLLLQYFKDNNIDIGDGYFRTALNIYSTLPDESEKNNDMA
jgi:hypothetical protein